MTDIVKGMAQELDRATGGSGLADKEDIDAMRAALLWLADNVSDKMAHHAAHYYFDTPLNEAHPPSTYVAFGGIIAAAIRAAAGGGE
jgi:hypothetical protein